MVDPGKVSRLLESLADYRRRLEALGDLPVDVYLRDQAFAGRYLVQVAAQTCVDTANHLIASFGWRAPADYRDAFTVLEEQGVIDPELAAQMRDLAGLRNRLVHLYEDVDDRIVHEALPEGIADLSRFAQAVARAVESG
jgi:uncharacterized protein YutE (UPF0331/DUF86 family)